MDIIGSIKRATTSLNRAVKDNNAGYLGLTVLDDETVAVFNSNAIRVELTQAQLSSEAGVQDIDEYAQQRAMEDLRRLAGILESAQEARALLQDKQDQVIGLMKKAYCSGEHVDEDDEQYASVVDYGFRRDLRHAAHGAFKGSGIRFFGSQEAKSQIFLGRNTSTTVDMDFSNPVVS